MANKQNSILFPFIISFSGSLIIGLCALYFGYYQTRISLLNEFTAEMNQKPTPETSFSFTVDDSETTQIETNEASDDSTKQETGDDKQSGSMKSEKESEESSESSSKPRKAKPIDRRSRRPSSRQSETRKPPRPISKSDEEYDDRPVSRGPAFPSSTNQADDIESMEEAGDYDEKPDRIIPDMNDPEMDDNPLIRALREASKKQGDNPRPRDVEPQNPFEAILNIDK